MALMEIRMHEMTRKEKEPLDVDEEAEDLDDNEETN